MNPNVVIETPESACFQIAIDGVNKALIELCKELLTKRTSSKKVEELAYIYNQLCMLRDMSRADYSGSIREWEFHGSSRV